MPADHVLDRGSVFFAFGAVELFFGAFGARCEVVEVAPSDGEPAVVIIGGLVAGAC